MALIGHQFGLPCAFSTFITLKIHPFFIKKVKSLDLGRVKRFETRFCLLGRGRGDLTFAPWFSVLIILSWLVMGALIVRSARQRLLSDHAFHGEGRSLRPWKPHEPYHRQAAACQLPKTPSTIYNRYSWAMPVKIKNEF
jgi:hypothetical protein